MTTIAVLTGDIIKSTKLPADGLQNLRDVILAALDDTANFADGSAAAGKAEFFRGDEWQAVVSAWPQALRAAVLVRAAARAAGADTRVAIGIGEVEQLDAENISLSVGEAFVRSGHALDEMKRGQALALAGAPFSAAAQPWVQATLRFCDVTISRWTSRQAEFALGYLREPPAASLADIANSLGTRPQTVSASLSASGWRAVAQLLTVFAEQAQAADEGAEKELSALED